MADLALAITTGNDWLGFHTGPVQPVLYMNFEIPAYHFQRRLEAISTKRGLKVPDELVIWNMRGYATASENLEDPISDQAKNYHAAMVIADPLYKIMGKNTEENAATDMAQLFNSLERIAVKSGAAVAYAGHFSKGNQATKNPMDRTSGSGVHARDPDTLIIFTRHKVENAYTVDFVLRCYAPVPSFVVRWDFPLMVRDNSLDPRELQKKEPAPKGRKTKLTIDQLVAVLEGHRKFVSTDAFYEATNQQHKVSRRTFDGLIPLLKFLPGILHLPDGQWVYSR